MRKSKEEFIIFVHQVNQSHVKKTDLVISNLFKKIIFKFEIHIVHRGFSPLEVILLRQAVNPQNKPPKGNIVFIKNAYAYEQR
jgi:hypothetical protein